MMNKYEVVEFRKCSGCCGNENYQEEYETVLFQHEDKSQCIHYMKMRGHEKGNKSILIKDETELDYEFYFGKRIGTVHLRVQKISRIIDKKEWKLC